jgi:hypothetical protein
MRFAQELLKQMSLQLQERVCVERPPQILSEAITGIHNLKLNTR